MKKIVGNIITVICVAFLLWIAVSFVEINSKNLSENPQYWRGNFFTIMVEWSGK